MNIRNVAKMKRLAAAATLLLASTVGMVAAAGPAQAAPSCTVRITPNSWTVDANDNSNYYWDSTGHLTWNGRPTAGIGFLDTFEVTNTGDPVHGWTVAFSTPPNTHLVGARVYSATLISSTNSPTGTGWQLGAAPWNPDLATGGRASFGMQGVVSDPTLTRVAISGFSLGAQPCTVLS
jgi:hypothetical protein